MDPAQPRRARLPAGVDTLVIDVGAKSSLAFAPDALPRHRAHAALVGLDNIAVVAFEPINENLQVLYDWKSRLPPEYQVSHRSLWTYAAAAAARRRGTPVRRATRGFLWPRRALG